MDGGAGFAGYAVLGLFQQRDEGGAAGGTFGKLHGGLHLGQHGTGGKVPLTDVLAGLVGGQGIQPLFIGLAEVDGNLFYGSEDDKGCLLYTSPSPRD